MKSPSKKRIKARRKWVINPKTRIVEDKGLYKRQEIKKETKELYERNKSET
jgi:hypothetical protein